MPDRCVGAALFADLVGFTALAESLARELGSRRGAEELVARLNRIYDQLIVIVTSYGGSVIGFNGDAMTCWFDDGPALLAAQNAPPQAAGTSAAIRAAHCGAALLAAIRQADTAPGSRPALRLSVAVVSGPVRRFLVGTSEVQLLDVLAGRTLDRLIQAESLAAPDELIVDQATLAGLAGSLAPTAWRGDDDALGSPFAVIALPAATSPPPTPQTALPFTDALARPWLPPAARDRLGDGDMRFLDELRPATALMLAFSGIDYDGDDQAGERLDAYIRWVQRTLVHYGGSLLDLTVGDASSYLYAVFGVPLANEDDAARAVAAAWTLRRPPPELAFVSRTSIGLAHGPMRAGTIGGADRRAYGVLGDPANLAFRLMRICPQGEVRCDQVVARQSGRRWAFDDLPVVQLKGKAEPVALFTPTGRLPVEPTVSEAGHAALIGRDAELAHFDQALADCQVGQGRVVVVEGEAGIGKSRLLHAWQDQARGHGLVALAGAGQSLEQQTPYRAWREPVQAYFGLSPGQTPASQVELIQRWAVEHAPHLAERLPLLNEVLDLGLPESTITRGLDPRQRSLSLDTMVAELLELRAAQGPLLLAIEDAHWLDSRSWDLVVQAARGLSTAGQPLLLVVALRPLEQGHAALAQLASLLTLPCAIRLSLGPLDEAQTTALAAAHLGIPVEAVPPAVGALIGERARGNPLFVEELVKALFAQRLVAHDPQGSDQLLVGDLSGATELLPTTIEGLLLARLDRLPADTQLTVKVAAAIGETFTYQPLYHTRQSWAPTEEGALRRQLNDLAVREFTWLETPEPELSYRFRHVLLQDAAYQTLPYSERQALHRVIAGWHERQYGLDPGLGAPRLLPRDAASRLSAQQGAQINLLAHHYARAEDDARERFYAYLAGVGAADRYALEEAARYLTRALELTPADDLAEQYDLLLAREEIYHLRGDSDARLRDLTALRALADDRRRGVVLERLARHYEQTDALEAALEAALQARALADTLGDHDLAIIAQSRIGSVQMHLGGLETARQASREALDLARAAGDMASTAAALNVIALTSHDLCEVEVARSAYEESLRIYRALGDLQDVAGVQLNLAALIRDVEGAAAAFPLNEDVLRIARRVGLPRVQAMALNNMALLYCILGDYGAALDANRQSLSLFQRIGDRHGEATALNALGSTHFELGDDEYAERCYQQSGVLRQAIGSEAGVANIALFLAFLYRRQGRDEAALANARQAVAMFRVTGYRHGEAVSQGVISDVLLAQGQLEQARAAMTAALVIARELGPRPELPEPLAGAARLALAEGDLPAALAYVEEALAWMPDLIFTQANEPMRVERTCYEVLRAAGDPRALQVLAAAQCLIERELASMKDERLRVCYVEGVPDRHALIKAWSGERDVSGQGA